jgi:hypothetical protein
VRGETRPRRGGGPGARDAENGVCSVYVRARRVWYRRRCGHENEIYGSRPGLTSTRGRAPYAAERPFAAILRMSSPISSRFFLPRPWVPSCFVREKKRGDRVSGASGVRREARGARAGDGDGVAVEALRTEASRRDRGEHARRARFPSRGGPADAGGFAAPRASRETLETFLCRYAPSAWRA